MRKTHTAQAAQAAVNGPETTQATTSAKAKGKAKVPTLRSGRDAETGIPNIPQGVKGNADPEKAAQGAEKAQGEALAVVVIDTAKREEKGWRGLFNDIHALSLVGLQAFRLKLDTLRDEWQKENGAIRGATMARISECKALAEACEKGWDGAKAVALFEKEMPAQAKAKADAHPGKPLSLEDVPHAALVKLARDYRDATKVTVAADGSRTVQAGPTERRGRKAKSGMEKIEAYLRANIPQATFEQGCRDVITLCEKMIAEVQKAHEAAAKVAADKAADKQRAEDAAKAKAAEAKTATAAGKGKRKTPAKSAAVH